MTAPLLSTITLFTEIGVTLSVIYIFYQGWKKNRFPYKLTLITLGYEVLFNISYMVFSSAKRDAHEAEAGFTPAVAIAIFHGIFSLIMFVALVAFLITAYRHFRRGINYFASHPRLSETFLFFWFIAIASGIGLYLTQYVIH